MARENNDRSILTTVLILTPISLLIAIILAFLPEPTSMQVSLFQVCILVFKIGFLYMLGTQANLNNLFQSNNSAKNAG